MFSLKPLSVLLFGSFLVVSCAPLPPFDPMNPNGVPPNAIPPSGIPVPGNDRLDPVAKTEEEKRKQEQIKANEEARKRREALEREKNERIEPIAPKEREPIAPPSKYRTAMAIPGKPGYVFNPWTNKSVDVRGIPKGTLIRDPNDGNPDHKFRVP